jgi:hypothetical protein
MSNDLKIQLLRRACCNTIFAGCVEPYCYTDEDWLKDIKRYVDNGCVVEYVEAGKGLKFEKCKCVELEGGNNE